MCSFHFLSLHFNFSKQMVKNQKVQVLSFLFHVIIPFIYTQESTEIVVGICDNSLTWDSSHTTKRHYRKRYPDILHLAYEHHVLSKFFTYITKCKNEFLHRFKLYCHQRWYEVVCVCQVLAAIEGLRIYGFRVCKDCWMKEMEGIGQQRFQS